MLYIPPAAETVVAIPLTGTISADLSPMDVYEGAVRINSLLVPRSRALLGVAIQSLLAGASSPAEIDVLLASVIDGALDPDSGNDVSLFPGGDGRPTIDPGKNFGEFAPIPGSPIIEAGQVITINCITSGSSEAVDPGKEYFAVWPAPAFPTSLYFTAGYLLNGTPYTTFFPIGTPLDLSNQADDFATAKANLEARLIAHGYTPPNPIQHGAFPSDAPGASPGPADVNGGNPVFYFETDPGDAQISSLVGTHGGAGGYHPTVAAGPPVNGAAALLFFE